MLAESVGMLFQQSPARGSSSCAASSETPAFSVPDTTLTPFFLQTLVTKNHYGWFGSLVLAGGMCDVLSGSCVAVGEEDQRRSLFGQICQRPSAGTPSAGNEARSPTFDVFRWGFGKFNWVG